MPVDRRPGRPVPGAQHAGKPAETPPSRPAVVTPPTPTDQIQQPDRGAGDRQPDRDKGAGVSRALAEYCHSATCDLVCNFADSLMAVFGLDPETMAGILRDAADQIGGGETSEGK